LVDRRTDYAKRTQSAGVKCAKRTQFPASRALGNARLCKTKPILRLRIADWAQTCGRATNRAKRTQFPASRAPWNVQLCETNPILRLRIADCGLRIGHRPLAGRRIVQNEPNFGRAEIPNVPVFHYSTFPVRCVSCETNPIWHLVSGNGRRPVDGDRIVQNEPNSRRCRVGRGQRGGGRRANAQNEPNFARGPVSGGESCKTNPIRGEAWDAASGTRGGAYRAKRSQFAILGPSRWARYPPPDAGPTRGGNCGKTRCGLGPPLLAYQ